MWPNNVNQVTNSATNQTRNQRHLLTTLSTLANPFYMCRKFKKYLATRTSPDIIFVILPERQAGKLSANLLTVGNLRNLKILLLLSIAYLSTAG